MGKTSFRVLFLPTEEGNIESSLFINTSSHGVLSYQVTLLIFHFSFEFVFLKVVFIHFELKNKKKSELQMCVEFLIPVK